MKQADQSIIEEFKLKIQNSVFEKKFIQNHLTYPLQNILESLLSQNQEFQSIKIRNQTLPASVFSALGASESISEFGLNESILSGNELSIESYD